MIKIHDNQPVTTKTTLLTIDTIINYDNEIL